MERNILKESNPFSALNDLDMKCEVCKFYLQPRWCDKFDIETDPEKECDGCPEATQERNARVRTNLRTVGQLVQEYLDKYGLPKTEQEFNDAVRHFYMQGFNNGALEENREWTKKSLTYGPKSLTYEDNPKR